MMGRYYSYTEGNGPFHIWEEGVNPVLVSWSTELHRVVYAVPTMPECDGSVYSDRLWQADSDKHDRLWAAHCTSKDWNAQTPEAVSAYLTASLERPVQLVALWQYNHAFNGFPIWLMFYRHVEAAPVEAGDRG